MTDQSTPKVLPWTLPAKHSTIYHQVKCEEHTDLELVEGFIQDDMGISYEGVDRYNAVPYDNEAQQIMKYKTKYNKITRTFHVTHRLPAHKWGRTTPTNHLSLSVQHRPTRHAFSEANYIDFDMVNCHPSIINAICVSHGVCKPMLAHYAAHPKAVRQQVAEFYNTSVGNAKSLLLRILFGGKAAGWLKEFNLGDEVMPDVLTLTNEMLDISELVYTNNPIIKRDVLKHCPNKWKTEAEAKRGVMALWSQDIERQIMEYCVQSLDVPIRDVVPCQDGFMILKKHFSPDICDLLNKRVIQRFGLDISWAVKPFDEAISIRRVKAKAQLKEELAEAKAVIRREREADTAEKFKALAEEHERQHCLIIDLGVYIRHSGNVNTIISPSQMNNAFMHIPLQDSGKPFITHWMTNNANIRAYTHIGVFPRVCPPDTYNLWTPFDICLYPDYIPPDCPLCETSAVLVFVKHIEILCNHEVEVAKYIIQWIGHLVQYPDQKSTMPTFISDEGAGKGTLIELLRIVLGNSKVFETTNPSRDVWGSFNSPMKDAYLVCLNELSAQDLKNSMGQVKSLITDPKLTINTKGLTQFEINSYHKFIAATNSHESIKTSAGDRRNIIISCSNELCKAGKSDAELSAINEYFDVLRDIINSKNDVRTIYEYLMEIPDLDGFGTQKPPQTSFQIEQRELTVSPVEAWLKEWVLYQQGPVVTIPSSALFKECKKWIDNNMAGYSITSMQFGVRLSRLNIPGITSMRDKFKSKEFDIAVLFKHFGFEPSEVKYDSEEAEEEV